MQRRSVTSARSAVTRRSRSRIRRLLAAESDENRVR
jgi:hypothetical protein